MNKFRVISVFVVLAMVFSFANVSPANAATTTISLQQGTATFSQEDWCCGLNVDEAVDGVFSGVNGPGDPYNGWAIYNGSSDPQTAVWETASDVDASQLDFTLYQTWGGVIGRFRLSYTTDDRNTFADGLNSGGDVTANWTELTGATISGTSGETFTELADKSILVSGPVPPTSVYSVSFAGSFSGITGIRLEVLSDPSFPNDGPGREGNGNFHLVEFTLDATTAPNPLYPESCQDIRYTNPSATDGDYVIYPNNQVFTVYCNDMAGSPSEYLSLVNTGGASNFSQYTAGGASAGTNAVTHYTKVRLNPNTLLVDINDKTFTTSTGSIAHGTFYVTEMDYAVAMDCSAPGGSTGQGNIDLRGTRFAVIDTFVPDGWIPSPGQANFSFDDQVVDLQGGGYCGWISPARRPAHDPLSNDVAYVLALRLAPNVSPTVDAGGPYSGNEGSAIAMSGATASDPDMDALTYTWTVDSALCNFDVASALNPNLTCSDNGSYTTTLSVSDGVNPAVTNDATVNVSNVAPTVGLVSVPAAPIDINNQPVTGVSAPFTDPGTADIHTCTVDYGDGSGSQTGTVAAGVCTGLGHTYTEAGVYVVTVAVIDDDLDTGSATATGFIVVYDPSGGFVTGGGWIDSPAGAYKADESLSGKASFGFVAKYKKGATVPDGNTQFQFKAGDLNFHSTSYEWLVVAGNKAQFKGEGTINGQGSYMFKIWADDDNPDTFRIMIWGDNGVVYDNGSQQSLGGGSIKVHNK